MSYRRKKVLVLGGGYAGLQTVASLQKKFSQTAIDITLINRNEYHYEATWLHETAAGTMHWEDGTYPITKVLDDWKVKFVPAEVNKINPERQSVETNQGEFIYDILVLALGFESETFGIEGMDEYADSIVSPQSSVRAYENIRKNFERYTHTKDPRDVSILVGGAGFTGIEFLGELTESVPKLCEEFGIDKSVVNITCVEAMPKMLPMFSEKLVDHAKQFLDNHNIRLMLNTAITAANENGFVVKVDDAEKQLEASSVVWTAGVRGNRIMDETFGDKVKRGRIVVQPELNLDTNPEIFVIGDVAAVMDGEGPDARPHPTTAQIAVQMGEHVAKNIAHIEKGEKLIPFKFDNKGTVCSLGSKDGVGVVMGREVTGSKAAFMKKVIDTRSIYKIGGPMLAYQKGKLF